MPMLKIENLHAGYDEVRVVRGISFTVEPGEIVAMLGRNGAGKTTTLRCLAGLIHPTQGRVVFAGRDIDTMPAHEIANLGVALVPEGRGLFPKHTVRENLELGAYQHLRRGRNAEFRDSVDEIVHIFPQLGKLLDQPAGVLSGGEQQMVAISRALVSRPRLLMLDEPSLGLSPMLVRMIFEAFARLRSSGLTILIVEQMARSGLSISNRALVLESGKIVLSGNSGELVSDPRIVEAYLGTATDFSRRGDSPCSLPDQL
jgi:branched-chain amino acid transport system ATP-binding protein